MGPVTLTARVVVIAIYGHCHGSIPRLLLEDYAQNPSLLAATRPSLNIPRHDPRLLAFLNSLLSIYTIQHGLYPHSPLHDATNPSFFSGIGESGMAWIRASIGGYLCFIEETPKYRIPFSARRVCLLSFCSILLLGDLSAESSPACHWQQGSRKISKGKMVVTYTRAGTWSWYIISVWASTTVRHGMTCECACLSALAEKLTLYNLNHRLFQDSRSFAPVSRT